MGWMARLFGREGDETRLPGEYRDSTVDSIFWGGQSSHSVTGIAVNQWSALNASPVMSCVTMLAEDVAKLPWSVFREPDGENRKEATDHYLYDLLQEPNSYQNGLEFRETLQLGLIMRGNALAPIKRNQRGWPIALIPVNPDWVQAYVGTGGSIFYRVTTSDLLTRELLADMPAMIPAEDMLHIRGFSLTGLLGASRIGLAREAIALSIAQEQQAARWMGNGAKPSGMLTTDAKLSEDAAKRIKADIRENWTGLQNSGRMIIGEQGLKFIPFSMTSADLEFIGSRKFQVEEIARIFRIPLHMIGELSRSTNNNIAQLAQEYINYTLTGYTNRWRAKMSQCFGLRRDKVSIEFDYRELTTADMTTRINNWRTMIMSMMGKPDEARIDLGLPPEGGEANKLHFPQNMAAGGSQSTGTTGDGGGRPPADGTN